MLKKFGAKGEYLYVGLFVISCFAVSYNPIQYINDKPEYIRKPNQDTNNEQPNIASNNLTISQKVNKQIVNFEGILSSTFAHVSKNSLPSLENKNYRYLTLDNLYKSEEYHHMFFEDKKVDLLTVRRLADYISSTYKINLDTSELIVLDTYKESINNGLEPLLMLSLIGTESSYRKDSVSVVGAIGLTQVYPIFHSNKIDKLKKQNLDLWSIKGNIKVGSSIFKEYIDLSNGNIANALQRYNGSLGDNTFKYSNKVFSKKTVLENVAKL